MLISRNLHKKSSEVSFKTRWPSASLSFKGQATGQAIVKWCIPEDGIVRAKEDGKVKKYQDLASEVRGMCTQSAT